jgi:flagellar hook-basal body complex protein FliE
MSFKKTEKYSHKYYAATFQWTKKKMELGIYLHDKIIPAFNKVKKNLDIAYKEKNIEDFEKYLKELDDTLRTPEFNLTKALKIAKQKTATTFKVSSPYQQKLIASLDWVKSALEGAQHTLKQMKMTPAQRDASAKASANMRARWGGMY